MALVKPCLYSRCHIYCAIFAKICQKISPNDIFDEFENGSGWLKNMATRGWGIFTYIAMEKTLFYTVNNHIYCPIFMKPGMNLCSNYILYEFENGSGLLKNMAARGWSIFHYMAKVNPC